MQMALNANQMTQPTQLDANSRKIESKDSMWKPAPIMGREMTQQTIHQQRQEEVYQPQSQFSQPQSQFQQPATSY